MDLTYKVTGDFVAFFLYRSMLRGNQHGDGKYDDLQNWLDMKSHENPLLMICLVTYNQKNPCLNPAIY